METQKSLQLEEEDTSYSKTSKEELEEIVEEFGCLFGERTSLPQEMKMLGNIKAWRGRTTLMHEANKK